ncbi:hypothetical protein SAMN06893096_102446 [Geodermatophilus pulveris]|uniref:Uncharacterized protein n=1 Tax=Geodermatophilus pulveris TaxID=1564159 RepID=A0A239CIG9_9ACTN|nr:hypothetical protein [Geodermatophilus pulveris]SNS19478.1 hypothetical protein SAMN06893096_102446 [Geodermatophilus pulveris]
MTGQQPIEPDAILGRDGTAVPRGHGGVPQPVSPSLLPALARVVLAGPLLAASAVALTAAAAVTAVELAGRMARPRTGAPGPGLPGGFELTITRVEIRWPS